MLRFQNVTTGLAWLLVGIWFLIPLGTIGLFDDGVFYGAIARNWVWAADSANWWQLKVSDSLDANFNGHPPLAFWLESLLFRAFGEAYWVERLYSLLMALGCLQAVRSIWRLLLPEAARWSYLPIIFWLSMPIVGWSYGNNMLENTLAFFALWAVWAQLKFSIDGRWAYMVLALICIFGATMSKGPVGLYPLAVLPLWAICQRRGFIGAGLYAVGLGASLAGLYVLLCAYSPEAKAFWLRYLELQLLPSISGESMATSRLVVIEKMLSENIPAWLLLLVGYGYARYANIQTQIIDNKVFMFLLLLAFSASLPIMLSPKQLPFYIVPALPIFAMLWAVIALGWVQTLSQKPQPRWIAPLLGAAQVACLVVMVFRWGQIARNRDMLHDIFLMQPLVQHQTIGLHQSLYNQWNLHGYMYRFGYTNLSTAHVQRPFWLLPKNDTLRSPGYTRLDLPLRSYQLYQLNTPPHD